jgi:hypothetical protein
VEVSRKHGSFDTRWLCADKAGSGAMPVARFFGLRTQRMPLTGRGSPRVTSPSAYVAYKQGREWRKKPALKLVHHGARR